MSEICFLIFYSPNCLEVSEFQTPLVKYDKRTLRETGQDSREDTKLTILLLLP